MYINIYNIIYISENIMFVHSSALGASCNSSSSLFVASDGVNMRLYQAVIDARGLLATDGGTDSRGHKVCACLLVTCM